MRFGKAMHRFQEEIMKGYRIKFFNELPDDRGHVWHCCQGIVEIHAAKTKDRAIQAAKHRFARTQAVTDWTNRARSFEAEEIAH